MSELTTLVSALVLLTFSATDTLAIHIGPCNFVTTSQCDDSLIQFYLYTRDHQNNGEFISFGTNMTNITESSFNKNLPNKVIIHGYNADMNLDALVSIKNEYLKEGEKNVWMINWATLAAGPCYPAAVYNIEYVGRCVANFVNVLKFENGPELELDLHIIGFSLGAHVSGVVARWLRPYKMPRVTGLDPAMPLFVGQNSLHKLTKDDAIFVDVIHTNALVQGLIETLGHVDFYLNGGVTQPGCTDESNPLNCDHHRAPEYFAESINTNVGFYGWKCTSLVRYYLGLCPPGGTQTIMGEHISNKTTGLYMVKTSSHSPYALGKYF